MIVLLALVANTTISAAYLAISVAILAPLIAAGQLKTNRLGVSTAAIFASCAVGHAFHAYGALAPGGMGSGMGWPQAVWDLTTAAVALNYWSQRRTYGSLMQGAALFEGLEQQRRITELEHRESLAAARADTAREREARLRGEAEQREVAFQSRFDEAVVGRCLNGLDGRYLRVNAVFAELLGRTPAELEQLTFRDVTHPDDLAESAEERESVLLGEQVGLRLSKRFLRPDGAVVHVELFSTLVRDGAGAPLHFAAQIVDVSDRERAQRDRAAQAELLTAIIDNSQSVIHAKDLDGRYLLVNRVLRERLGLTETEILGRSDADIHAHVNPEWTANDLRARDGVSRAEETVTRADGSMHVYESVRFPLHDADGVLYGTCGVSLDVTTLRQAAAERELVAQAIAEAAVRASEAKSRFLASMSHEIRTPLNGVLGLVALLKDSELDERQTSWARLAERSGRALLTIVNDVLDTAKIEAGAMELEHVALDLGTVVDDAVAPLRTAAEAKGLFLVLAPVGELNPHRLGDPTRLRQVITNLVANAVTFTERGAVTVLLAGTSEQVTVTVTDTGRGMSTEQQLRLFTPFVQAEASTTRQYGGTGLGLSIVRGLIEAMAGSITVVSTPGQGSSFTVQLPLPGITAARPAQRRERPGPAGPRRGPHVLVAEDNEVNQIVARATLQARGITLDIVPDGVAAVAAVGSGAYDAVLMDRQMPGMDGLEATRRIRADERTTGRRRIPIIAMTASAFDADRTACREAGMDAFLPKPWTPQELDDALALLDGDPSAGPLLDPDAGRIWHEPRPGGPVDDCTAVEQRLAELLDGVDESEAAPMRRRMIEVFCDRVPRLLDELDQAAVHRDADALGAAAHALRGMAGNLGAHTITALAAALEDRASSPGQPDAGALLLRLRVVWLHLRDRIRSVDVPARLPG